MLPGCASGASGVSQTTRADPDRRSGDSPFPPAKTRQILGVAAYAALDGASATLALGGGAVGVGMPLLLVSDDRRLGVQLVVMTLVLAGAAVAVGRRWWDLGWVIGVDALLLGGVGRAADVRPGVHVRRFGRSPLRARPAQRVGAGASAATGSIRS